MSHNAINLRHDVLPMPSASEILRRPHAPVHGDAARAHIEGRRVLVSGAGGSIGSEIVRQVSELGPAAVFLLDHDENSLHAMQLEMSGAGLLDDDSVILADIRETDAIDAVMRRVAPDIVFHAAAHKHLPLLERFPAEALRTNVLGTRNLVEAAVRRGVATFVNISTDKAANPTSILGASKRLAEMIVSSAAGGPTRFASVRFGNVLGSQGSFLRSLSFQMHHGLPVTVTHREVTRYFMTILEASSLVIEAAHMASEGEIYVLDMGAPVAIMDVVERFAATAGLPYPQIRLTGLRPGEKLHEDLYEDDEVRSSTVHPRIWRVAGAHAHPVLDLTVLDPDVSSDDVRRSLFASLVQPDVQLTNPC